MIPFFFTLNPFLLSQLLFVQQQIYANFFLLLHAGDVEKALDMTNELLQLKPDHKRANGNKFYYEKEIKELAEKKKVKGDDGTDEIPISDLVSIFIRHKKCISLTIYFAAHCQSRTR